MPATPQVTENLCIALTFELITYTNKKIIKLTEDLYSVSVVSVVKVL